MILPIFHSYYSLLRGTRSPQDVCRTAARLGYTRPVLADRDNLYGMWFFIDACKENGLRPIIGAEVTASSSTDSLFCLVKTGQGYQNLCRLITLRHCDDRFSLIQAVSDHQEGLVVLARTPQTAAALHGQGIDLAAVVNDPTSREGFQLSGLAQNLQIPMVAAPDFFLLDPEDMTTHRILRAVDLNAVLSRPDEKQTMSFRPWPASPREYVRCFQMRPESIRQTKALIERLEFTGPDNHPVMPPWPESRGSDHGAVLRQKAYQGACRRYGYDLPENVVDRLEHELAVITKKGFAPYFLVVADIVSLSPRICGRGSGAASLVSYCLFITDVCPVKHNLYFERFLNPDRSDPPDLDIDFAWDERNAVIGEVLKKYRGRAALVCNMVTFRARMAVREAAKVFGMTAREINRVVKGLSRFADTSFSHGDMLRHIKESPRMRGVDFSRPWPQIISLARRLIGVPRYLSVHPGGIVITPDRLDNHVPIEPAPKGVPVIQWEKDSAEAAGLVKIDLLGNRSLGVIRDAIAGIRVNGSDIDETNWEPEEDGETKRTIAAGNTMGCFYIESPAMRLLQKKTRVGDFNHVVIHSSIIRPAANEFIREYIRRLKGGSWSPIHPLVADVLDETYGIMVYQEDVSKTAVATAGFSHAEADGLRKIMSKKDREATLADYKQRFTAGAEKRGVSRRDMDKIWDMMMSFSGYSFCKPHSAGYARISFQAAYLKTHYPAEFMAAVISNGGGFYGAFAYVSEARRMGLNILPPDINKSSVAWQGKGDAIQVGLLSIKHLKTATQQRIITQRQAGPYRHLTDFLNRVQPDVPEARSLIFAGAFDSLYPSSGNTALWWELAAWKKKQSSFFTQPDLFEDKSVLSRPVFPPDHPLKRPTDQFAVLGFLCDFHPMAFYRQVSARLPLIKAENLADHVGKRVRTAGFLIAGKTTRTKQGDPMEFLTFEDETGLVETVFFPKTYARFCALLSKKRPYILSGKAEQEFGAVTLTVSHVEPLAEPPVNPS